MVSNPQTNLLGGYELDSPSNKLFQMIDQRQRMRQCERILDLCFVCIA